MYVKIASDLHKKRVNMVKVRLYIILIYINFRK